MQPIEGPTHLYHLPSHPFPALPPPPVTSPPLQVFDAGSRSVLRQLKGHSRPVHVTRFASDKTHILSGGDDVTLRWWDLASGKQLLRLVGHEDYVRAAAASSSSSDTWASGEGAGGWVGGA
jgi:U3 small nucleolar RNA-associated protein 15